MNMCVRGCVCVCVCFRLFFFCTHTNNNPTSNFWLQNRCFSSILFPSMLYIAHWCTDCLQSLESRLLQTLRSGSTAVHTVLRTFPQCLVIFYRTWYSIVRRGVAPWLPWPCLVCHGNHLVLPFCQFRGKPSFSSPCLRTKRSPPMETAKMLGATVAEAREASSERYCAAHLVSCCLYVIYDT